MALTPQDINSLYKMATKGMADILTFEGDRLDMARFAVARTLGYIAPMVSMNKPAPEQTLGALLKSIPQSKPKGKPKAAPKAKPAGATPPPAPGAAR